MRVGLPKENMGPEDIDPLLVNTFLKMTGPHLKKPGVDKQTNSRYKLCPRTQQASSVKQKNMQIIPES